jgi:hypothetical protein
VVADNEVLIDVHAVALNFVELYWIAEARQPGEVPSVTTVTRPPIGQETLYTATLFDIGWCCVLRLAHGDQDWRRRGVVWRRHRRLRFTATRLSTPRLPWQLMPACVWLNGCGCGLAEFISAAGGLAVLACALAPTTAMIAAPPKNGHR